MTPIRRHLRGLTAKAILLLDFAEDSHRFAYGPNEGSEVKAWGLPRGMNSLLTHPGPNIRHGASYSHPDYRESRNCQLPCRRFGGQLLSGDYWSRCEPRGLGRMIVRYGH